MERSAPLTRLSAHPRLIRLVEWGVLFLVLLLATWSVTQSQAAPHLILLSLLTIITLNFTLPPERGAAGLTPVVVMSSLLLTGLPTAVALLLISLALAELARPLWYPLWEQAGVARPTLRQRLGLGVVHTLSLICAGLLFTRLGGVTPLPPEFVTQLDLNQLTWLAIAYGGAHFGLMLLFWLLEKRPWPAFWQNHALTAFTYGFLAQPFAWLGSITFIRDGLPTFVIFSLGVTLFSVVVWLSWQRRYVMEQRLAQFAALNQNGMALRETLDLTAVLSHTIDLVQALVPVDAITITLGDEQGQWRQMFPVVTPPPEPDDFTRWVLQNGRVLDLDQRDLPFAARHNLTPPHPAPRAWLGLPLTSAGGLQGALVLQRFDPRPPFNQWQRELLLTVAGQVSAAIQNARLHSETVRLYNLTDEALAQRLKQLQALLNSMQEGVLMLDTTGRIVLLNTPAAALLEQATATLYQQPLDTPHAAVPLGFTPDSLQALLDQLRAGEIPAPRQTVFAVNSRFFNRREAPVQAGAPDGGALGWLMLFRDITDEQQLAERRSDLTRMIVHDLRNPLTTLVSTVGLLESHLGQNSDEATELIDTARYSCLDMLDMVDSLMDVNRLEAGQSIVEAEAMRLPPLLAQVMKRVQPLAGQRQIRLTLTPPPADLPAVWADEELVRRVLLNLLDNALKFTPAGGEVNGRLQTEPAADATAEPGIRCIINDTGPGIPPELQQRVFDRFTRTTQAGVPVRGTGLGLTFCKLTIEAHNGRIWVENAPGGGSQFIFTLPGIPTFAHIQPTN